VSTKEGTHLVVQTAWWVQGGRSDGRCWMLDARHCMGARRSEGARGAEHESRRGWLMLSASLVARAQAVVAGREGHKCTDSLYGP